MKEGRERERERERDYEEEGGAWRENKQRIIATGLR